jgi:TRAP-type C4-dicarboxylate transport system substrate-binding protein
VGRSKSFFFVLEPLLMSKSIFDGLSKDDQKVIMDVGLEMEKFGRDSAQADDTKVAQIYEKAGAKATDLTQEQADKWKALARESCWKSYAAKAPGCAEFLKLSQMV